MFSQSAEYALRAVVHLGSLEGRPVATSTVAEATGTPPLYLAKVLQTLRKAGVVALRRGGSGGVMLARPTTEISMYDVVAAIDELPRISRCPLGVEAHRDALCPLHSRIDGALADFEKMMREATVAQIIEASRVERAGCTFPTPRRDIVSIALPGVSSAVVDRPGQVD